MQKSTAWPLVSITHYSVSVCPVEPKACLGLPRGLEISLLLF